MAIANFAQELSTKLTALIGYPLHGENIIHDHPGIEDYVTELKPGYPVMIILGRTLEGRYSLLTLIMAEDDYRRLEKAEVAVDRYIAESHFHYGYLKNVGQLADVYWRPLESDPGIHDTARVSHYLQQLNSAEGLTDETLGPDRRKDLFDAVRERIVKELGFEVYSAGAHCEAQNELHLYAGFEPNSAVVYVSWALINDALYHPDVEHNWRELVDSLKLVRRLRRNPEARAEIDPGMINKRDTCIMFWVDEFVPPEKTPESEVKPPIDKLKKSPWWQNLLQAVLELLDLIG